MTVSTQVNAEIALSEQRLTMVANLAEQMFGAADVPGTLAIVAQLARASFGCDEVTVSLSESASGAVTATDPDAALAERLVRDSHQGPGPQAIARREPVVAMDLRVDSRWRWWAPLAADLGFRSVLALRLDNGDTVGALTLYSRQTSFFDSDDVALAQVFAQHASIAVAIASERAQLLRAVQARGIVGQAQGVLMQRYQVSADQALTVLSRYAAELDQDLLQVAKGVVRHRCLPEDQAAPSPARVRDRSRIQVVTTSRHLEPAGS